MTRAPDIVQVGDWRIKDGAYGRNLYNLTHSTLPASLASISGRETVDDFCAERDVEGRGVQRFVPFGELDSVLQDGDLFVMTAPEDVGAVMTDADPMKRVNCLKQRGWHAEIVCKGGDGRYWQKAPWHSNLIKHPCSEMASHPAGSDFIVSIYRPELGVDPIRQAGLKVEVRRWVEIFCVHKFPERADQFNIHEYLDPADFETPEDLRRIAGALIRKEYDQVQKVTCVQWAYQVLCLALNVPLTPRLLKEIGAYEAYQEHWAGQLGYADDALEPLGRVPFVPYTPAETLQSFLNTYAEGVSLLDWAGKGGALASMLGFDLGVLSGQGEGKRAEVLAGYFTEVFARRDLTIPLVIPGRPPYRHVMPIQPFCEVRKPSRPDNLKWRYVATAVNGNNLVHA